MCIRDRVNPPLPAAPTSNLVGPTVGDHQFRLSAPGALPGPRPRKLCSAIWEFPALGWAPSSEEDRFALWRGRDCSPGQLDVAARHDFSQRGWLEP
eukprot:1783313-Alexandrium_andersonii.AAC.1